MVTRGLDPPPDQTPCDSEPASEPAAAAASKAAPFPEGGAGPDTWANMLHKHVPPSTDTRGWTEGLRLADDNLEPCTTLPGGKGPSCTRDNVRSQEERAYERAACRLIGGKMAQPRTMGGDHLNHSKGDSGGSVALGRAAQHHTAS